MVFCIFNRVALVKPFLSLCWEEDNEEEEDKEEEDKGEDNKGENIVVVVLLCVCMYKNNWSSSSFARALVRVCWSRVSFSFSVKVTQCGVYV